MALELPEFRNEIEIILVELEKKGLIKEGLDKKNLAAQIANELKDENISLANVKEENSDARFALKLACQAKADPENKFDIKLLFKNQFEMTDEERLQYQLDLRNGLNKMFNRMLELSPKYKGLSQEERDELLKQFNKDFDQLSEKLSDQFTKDDPYLIQNKNARDFLSTCFHLSSRDDLYLQLYGTTQEGGQGFIVQSVPAGNQIGAMNISQGTDLSYQSETSKPDPGVPDPLGIKLFNILNDLADNAVSDITRTLKDEGMLYESPKFKPPGISE